MKLWQVILGAVIIGPLLYVLHPDSREIVADGKTEITIWFGEVTRGRHQDVIDAFQRKYPQYRVVLGASAARVGLEGEGNPQRLMCGIAGGVPPEVVEYDRFAICQWAARGAFKDMAPLLEKDRRELEAAEARLEQFRRAEAEQSSPDSLRVVEAQASIVAKMKQHIVLREDFFENPWQECQYRNPKTRDVGQYGIPNTMDDRVLYFNSDMFARAGLVDETGEPKPPDTWEDVLTKRVDLFDASIDGQTIRSDGADFIARGVRPGDTLAHISQSGQVTRCLVDEVRGAHALIVRSAYAERPLALPARDGQHVKIFSKESACLKLSRWDERGNLRIVGFEPQHGNAWLYLYGWANGGRFLNEDGRTCLLDAEPIREALQWTTDVYDALGGADKVVAFRKSFQNQAQDPFILGQIAMFIHGDWFMRDLVRFKRNMRFGTYPPPIPARRFREGAPKVTWIAGYAYCIPSTCPEEKLEAAWALVKFLSSVEGGMILNEHDAQREHGQGRLYISRMKANRKLHEEQIRRYVDVPEVPERIRTAMRTHTQMVDRAYFRPVSPVGQVLWNAQADAQDLAWSHTMSVEAALKNQAAFVQRALDSFYAPPRGTSIVNWRLLLAGYFLALVVVGAVLFRRFRRTWGWKGETRSEARAGLTFVLPWLVGFVVLSGGPIVFSAIMSFTEYDVINDARFVGLDNYREMFTTDWGGPDEEGKETVPTGVRRALSNTLYMAIGLPIGMLIGLLLAMLLDSGVRGLQFYRTLFFIPAIMPIVAASILWLWVFNAQSGLLNWVLQAIGLDLLIDWMNTRFEWFNLSQPIGWLTNKSTSKPALIIMGLWAAGSSMIIWLAGLKDIPAHLYEAALIDGAGPMQRFLRITLPMLSPYILFNLIIGLIQTFQIFTQAYIMTPNGYPERSTYFYVYKLFDECFTYFRLGYGAAMAWVLFVILVVLTLINMRLSKKWVFYASE